MRDEGPRTPQAMRASVTDRLRALVKADPRLHLADLLRQFAYDRLLARIFTDKEADRWVLKGATALLARLGPEARHTRDVDLYAEAGDLDDAEAALRAVASRDLGDLFRFEVLPGTPAGAGSDTRGLRIIAYLGATEFARFPVDLVTHVNMTEEPDLIGPLVPVEVPGMVSAEYRVYPMVDHIADKVCAIHEMHYRLEGPAVPSTRYRDLVDLATVARSVEVEAAAVTRALKAEAARRGLSLPDRLTVPAEGDWAAGYARAARDAPGLKDRDLESAVDAVGRFVNPVLSGEARGRWNPAAMVWAP